MDKMKIAEYLKKDIQERELGLRDNSYNSGFNIGYLDVIITLYECNNRSLDFDVESISDFQNKVNEILDKQKKYRSAFSRDVYMYHAGIARGINAAMSIVDNILNGQIVL